MAYRIDDFRRTFGLKSPDHLKIDVDGIEVEGDNLWNVAGRIEAPLVAAGLSEVEAVRGSGSCRNWLFRREAHAGGVAFRTTRSGEEYRISELPRGGGDMIRTGEQLSYAPPGRALRSRRGA